MVFRTGDWLQGEDENSVEWLNQTALLPDMLL